MAFAHFSENISLGFSIFWRKDIHDLGNPRKIILIIFQRKNTGVGGLPPPQHPFSLKDVRKCIISESLIRGLFKTSKNIKINPITVQK